MPHQTTAYVLQCIPRKARSATAPFSKVLLFGSDSRVVASASRRVSTVALSSVAESLRCWRQLLVQLLIAVDHCTQRETFFDPRPRRQSKFTPFPVRKIEQFAAGLREGLCIFGWDNLTGILNYESRIPDIGDHARHPARHRLGNSV